MKILLTGANGQVGFQLKELLHNKNYDFIALTRDQLDISDSLAVNKIFQDYLPNIVINAAAYTAVDRSEIEIVEAHKVNSDGAKNLAQSAANIGAAIFHISTDYVFAGDSDHPYSEEDSVAPQGVYGVSKLAGENAVKASNPKHFILRTAWVFGEHGNNFVKTMVRLGREREKLGIVNDQIGGPTYAKDIADVLLEVASKHELGEPLVWGTYHYSGFPHVSWFEFAQAIFAEVELQGVYQKNPPALSGISTVDYPTPAKRPANSRLACEKIQKIYDVKLSDWKAALKNIKAYS